MLVRARARLEVTWEPAWVRLLVIVVAVGLGLGSLAVGSGTARAGTSARTSTTSRIDAAALSTAGQPARRSQVRLARLSVLRALAAGASLSRELAFLTPAQNSDGGFGAAHGTERAASCTRRGWRWAWRRPVATR